MARRLISLRILLSIVMIVICLPACRSHTVTVIQTAIPVNQTNTLTAALSATPAPTHTTTPPTVTWHYVAFGEESIISEAGATSYATHFAAFIADDLGVEVEVEFYTIADVLVKDQLDRLRNDAELRNAISNAQVITLATGDMDIIYPIINSYLWDSCGGEDNKECIRGALVDFRKNYDSLLNEILNLCSPGSLFRTMTLPVRSIHEVFGNEENLQPFYILLNNQIIASSRTHSIPVVMVHDSFGKAEESIANGYLNPAGWNPTESGAKVIANLHRKLGYESTCR